MKKITYTALLLICSCIAAIAQTGTIKGKVVTKQDSAAIWGASVYISGTVHSSFSEEDGTFILEQVPPGTYNLSAEDFSTGDSALMKGIVVIGGQTTEVTVKIGISINLGDEIVLEYEKPKAKTAAAAIDETKNETKVASILSTEEMKEKGDSKVASAAGRVSGVTVEGGKYVYVRGLSDRYSKTLLDGTEIPGLDPNRNAVQLDMFPTSFVQSLKVIKTFSPDLPGDFAGGLVDIRTKDFPEEFEVNVSGGINFNTQASFNSNFLSSPKGSTDFLGFDNGSRALPKVSEGLINSDNFPSYGSILFDDKNAEVMELVMDELNANMAPVTGTSFTPYNFGATIGNSIDIKRDTIGVKKQRLGYVVGINYRNSVSHFDEGTANVYDLAGTLNEQSQLNPLRLMSSQRSSEEVLIGALGKIGYTFNKNNKLVLSYLKNQSGKQTVSSAEGENIDDEFYYRSRSIGYLQRRMDNVILSGDHTFTSEDSTGKKKDRVIIDWKTAMTYSSQDEPDLRFFNDNLDEDGKPEFRYQNYTGPVRFFRSMEEVNRDVKLNFTFPFELSKDRELKLKAGASYVNKERTFTERRLDYALGAQTEYDGDVNAFLADDNAGYLGDNGVLNDIGVYVINQSNPINNYLGFSTVMAGYGMAELPLSTRFNAIVGARYEHTNLSVQSQKEGVEGTDLVGGQLLPSVNLNYALIKEQKYQSKKDTAVEFKRDMKLRLSFNQTLARPNFRELAPFAVEDFVNTSLVVGNPDLQLTQVLNYDFRWEFYPKEGEQISIAAFYKDFTNPIEQITSPTAANIEFTWVNNEKGRLYGVEFEMRKSLDFVHEKLSPLTLAGNVTLVQSSADINAQELEVIRGNDPDHADTRPLFGQSPYIVNTTLSYKNDSSGLNANVAFNVFGDRLVLVTKGGLPDIYELARPSLDFNIAKQFGKKWKVTLRAKNLLNPEYKQVHKLITKSDTYVFDVQDESFIYRNYRRGRTISIGVSYKFLKDEPKIKEEPKIKLD